MDVAGISPDRIAIMGQSLGTAVMFGVAEALINPPNAIEQDPSKKIELGAVMSVAGFSNMKDLLETYHIAGYIPVLAPLRTYPVIQRFLKGFVYETWNSDQRLATLVKKSSEKLKLYIVHAKNDMEIRSEHAEYLFYAAANATEPEGKNIAPYDVLKLRVTQDLGAEGVVNTWPEERSGGKLIQQWVVNWGGMSDPSKYLPSSHPPTNGDGLQSIIGWFPLHPSHYLSQEHWA